MMTDDHYKQQQRLALAWFNGLPPRERKRRLRRYAGERYTNVIAYREFQRREK